LEQLGLEGENVLWATVFAQVVAIRLAQSLQSVTLFRRL
jgi:hypothetical protein